MMIQSKGVNACKNDSSKKVIKRDLDKNIIQPDQLLNPKHNTPFKNNGKHLENTIFTQNQKDSGKVIDNKKQKHKLMKKQQVELALENNTKAINHITNIIDDPTKIYPMVYKNEKIKGKKNNKNDLKERRKLNEICNHSPKKWLSDVQKSSGHLMSKQECHKKKHNLKNMPSNESKKEIKDILNQHIDSKGSILPIKEIINKLKCLPFKIKQNDLIFMDHKQIVKTLETNLKKTKIADHSTGGLENTKPMINNSNTYKSVNAALKHVDAKSSGIQSPKYFRNKKPIKKHKLKRFKRATALSNGVVLENIKELPLKPKTDKKKRKPFTIYKIRSTNSYKNCTDTAVHCTGSYKEPFLNYQDLIHIANPKSFPKLNRRHPVIIPHYENTTVKIKSNDLSNDHKLSTTYSDILVEENGSSVLAVSHLKDSTKLGRSNSFDTNSDKVGQNKNCCQFPFIKSPNPQVKISNPLFGEHGKKLQFQLIKSLNEKQLKRDRKNVDYISDDIDRVDQSRRVQGEPSTLHEDHSMYIYANRESSTTSTESLKIAIRRDTEISNYGYSNNVLNVVIKQTKGSTSNIKTSQCKTFGGQDINCLTEPLKCIVEDDPSNNADKEILMKDIACQTEKLDLERNRLIVTSLNPCINMENTDINCNIDRGVTNPTSAEERFSEKLPNFNHDQHKGVSVYSVNNKFQQPRVIDDKVSPKTLIMLPDETYSNNRKTIKVDEFYTIINSDEESTSNKITNSALKNFYIENKDTGLANEVDLESKLKRIGIYDKKGFLTILDSEIDDKSEYPIKDPSYVNCPKITQQHKLFSESDINNKINKVEIKIQDNSNNERKDKHFINSKKLTKKNLGNERQCEMEHNITNKNRFCVVLPSSSVNKNHCYSQNIKENKAIISDNGFALMEKNVLDIGIQTNLDTQLSSRAAHLKNELVNLSANHNKTNSRNEVIPTKLSKEHILGNTIVKNSNLDMLCYKSRVVCGNVHSCGTCNNLALDDLIIHQTHQCKPVIIPIINAVQNYLDKMLRNAWFIRLIENCASQNVAKFNNALNGLLENCIDILQNMEIKECKTMQMNTTEYALSNPLEKSQFVSVLKDSQLERNKTKIHLLDTNNKPLNKKSVIETQNHSLQSNIKSNPFFVVIPSTEKIINKSKDNLSNNLTLNSKFKSAQQSEERDQKRRTSSSNTITDDLLLNKKQICLLRENKTKPGEENKFIGKENTLKFNVKFKNWKETQINEDDVSTSLSSNSVSNKNLFQENLKNEGEKAQICRKQLKYAVKSKSLYSVYSHYNDMYHGDNTSTHFVRPTYKGCSCKLGFGDISRTCDERKTRYDHWNNKATVKYDNKLNGSKLVNPMKIKNTSNKIFDIKRTFNYFTLRTNNGKVLERNGPKKTCSQENLRTLLRDTTRTNGSIISNIFSDCTIVNDKERLNPVINDHIENNKALLKYKLPKAKKTDNVKCREINSGEIYGLNSSLKVNDDLPSNKLLDQQQCGDTTGSTMIPSQSIELLNDLENSITFDELAAKVNDWKNKHNSSKSQNQNTLGIKDYLKAGNNIQSVRSTIESDTDLTNSKLSRCSNQQTPLKNNKMAFNLPKSTKNHSNTILDRISCNKMKLPTKTKKESNKSIFTVKDIGSESSISSSFSLPKNSMLFINSCHPSKKRNTSMENSYEPQNDDKSKKIYNIKYSADQHSVCNINRWISLSDCSLQTMNNKHNIMCATQTKHGEGNNNLRLQMDVKMNDVMHVELFCQPTESPSNFPS